MSITVVALESAMNDAYMSEGALEAIRGDRRSTR